MKKYIDKTKTIDGEEFDLHDSRLIDAVPEGKFLSDDFTWKTVEMPVVTQVIPNPPLEGDEDNLTGLQVGEVKYKIKDVRLPEATEQGKILQVGENGWQEATLPKDIQIVELSNWGLTDLTDEQYTLLTEANVIIKLDNYYFYKGDVQVDYAINYICPSSQYSSNSRFWYCINVYINPTSPEYKKYQVVSGSWINLCQANPSLSGSETELTSLAIGDTKYKIPSGGAVVTVNYPDYSLGGISITDEQVELLKKPNTILVRTYDNSSMIYIQDQSYMPSGSLIFYINPNYGAWANNDKTEIKYRRAQVNIDTNTIWFSQQSIFKIDANDSLSGNEPELTSLYIRDRLYKIPSGGSGNETLIETTYSNLKSLRDNSQLIPGCWYRITDYNFESHIQNVSSANHQFDIIVLALSTSVLGEEARAIQHSGDTYFANNNLNAWKIWYCLDNDTNRFEWAYSYGKGVIYRMIDEFNNDVSYDFKNVLVSNYYLFDLNGYDASLNTFISGNLPYVYNNKIVMNSDNTGKIGKPNLTFRCDTDARFIHIWNNNFLGIDSLYSVNIIKFVNSTNFNLINNTIKNIYKLTAQVKNSFNNNDIFNSNNITITLTGSFFKNEIKNSQFISISAAEVKGFKFSDNQYLSIENEYAIYNVCFHEGVGGSIGNILTYNASGGGEYRSLDVYAPGSQSIILGGNN